MNRNREILSITLTILACSLLILIIKSNIDANHYYRITTEASR